MKTLFNQVIILQLFLLVTVQSAPIHKIFCPMFPTAAECPPEPDNECNDDNKCAELYPGEGLKCCKDGCDLRCVPPLSKPVNTTLSPTTVKPVTHEVSGSCPIFYPPVECPPEEEIDHECSNDNECLELHGGQGFKCCKTGCYFRCVLPLVKPTPLTTTCPVFPPSPKCPAEPNDCGERWCHWPDRSYCKDGCKCDCHVSMREPVFNTSLPTTAISGPFEVQGKCPVFPPAECPPEPDLYHECNSDIECVERHSGLGFKCCKVKCKFQCVPPVVKPVKTTPSPSTVRPVTNVVSGTCPVYPPPDECPPEDDLYHECNDDNNCAERYPGQGLKCCKDGCGESSCVTPVVKPVNTTSSPSTVRPVTTEVSGTCPSFPPAYECPPYPDNECNNDNKCAELYPGLGYKCCVDGCDFICVPPLNKNVKTTSSPTTVRPVTNVVSGTCPVYPPPEECPDKEDLYHECNDDNNCAELYPGQGLKCCKDGCGEISCVSPVVKPVNTTSSPSTVRPVTTEVSGTCPSFPPAYECPPYPDNECNNDNKCAELYPGLGYKCCVDGCDFICVPPLNKNVKTTSSPTTVRPVTNVVSGTCPVYPPPEECPDKEDLYHECNDDNNCAELYPGQGLKCCKDGCGEISCVSPVVKPVNTTSSPSTVRPVTTEVSGTCPSFPPAYECPPYPDNECNNDNKCAELYPGLGYKCCVDGCDFICVPPLNKNVKTTSSPTTVRPVTNVVSGTCPVYPPPEECPDKEDLYHECNDDNNCAELYPGQGLKCCKDGCGEISCVSPVVKPVNTTSSPSTVRPVTTEVSGTCPSFPPAYECPPEPDNECNNDNQCAELYPGLGYKCCHDGCDFICVAPLNKNVKTTSSTTTVRPVTNVVSGTCPVYPPPEECPDKEDLYHECNDDNKCAELYPGQGLKCCEDGCGEISCVSPVVKPVL